MLIAPERKPHRTRTDLAVSKGYLIVAKRGIQASDKHDFFVYHILHIAAGPAVFVQTGKAAAALSRFVDYFLRYVVHHRFVNSARFLRALASPETTLITASQCSQVASRGLKARGLICFLSGRNVAFRLTRRRSQNTERERRQAGGSEQSRYPSFHRPGVIDIGGAEALYQFNFIGADAQVKPGSDGDGDKRRKRRL